MSEVACLHFRWNTGVENGVFFSLSFRILTRGARFGSSSIAGCQDKVNESAINRLQRACSADWKYVALSQEQSQVEYDKIATILDTKRLVPADTSFVVFGSLGRHEWTQGSDLDWTLLVDGQVDEAHLAIAHKIAGELDAAGYRTPGPTAIFGSTVFSHQLVHRIGGDHDSNRNTTQRILLLLESLNIGAGEAVRERVIRQLFKRYIEDDHGYRPAGNWKAYVPRFFLNDVVRYWRTMAVDFAAKRREREGDKWAIRNFKLRMSRKLLFVTGLGMSLSAELKPSERLGGSFSSGDEFCAAMVEHLVQFANRTPLENLASILLDYDAHSAGSIVFNAYDEFLGILSDKNDRDKLEKMDVDTALADPLFERSREIGKRYQDGLTQLFFKTDAKLTTAAQRFGVF